MRQSELLGVPVVDSAGDLIGGVADVVLVQDGPPLAPQAAASLRVAGLIVVEREHPRLLGYERDLRPALFRVLLRRMAGQVRQVGWEDIAEISPEGVQLRVPASSLRSHDRSARA